MAIETYDPNTATLQFRDHTGTLHTVRVRPLMEPVPDDYRPPERPTRANLASPRGRG